MAHSGNLVAAVLRAATGLASAARAQESTVLPFDLALTGFVGPQYAHPSNESGARDTATILLGGGQASVRFGPVSLGLRVGWTTEMPAEFWPA